MPRKKTKTQWKKEAQDLRIPGYSTLKTTAELKKVVQREKRKRAKQRRAREQSRWLHYGEQRKQTKNLGQIRREQLQQNKEITTIRKEQGQHTFRLKAIQYGQRKNSKMLEQTSKPKMIFDFSFALVSVSLFLPLLFVPNLWIKVFTYLGVSMGVVTLFRLTAVYARGRDFNTRQLTFYQIGLSILAIILYLISGVVS